MTTRYFSAGRNKTSTFSFWLKSYDSIVLIKFVLNVTKNKKKRIKVGENKGRCTLFTARSLRVLLADVGENTT
jgi:hypothetical protein